LLGVIVVFVEALSRFSSYITSIYCETYFYKDAFGNDRLREESQLYGSAYSGLLRMLGVREIEQKIGYTFREKSFLLQVPHHPDVTVSNDWDFVG
jgi:hypothetical protein